MASFNEEGLRKKLSDLNMSQQSIQTMSLWLIHHKKHARNITKIWLSELVKASDSKKMAFMYLSNDVIQNSKKKGPEYHKQFSAFLPKAFKHLSSIILDDKQVNSINRLFKVWEERGVFNDKLSKDMRKSFRPNKDSSTDLKRSSSEEKDAKEIKRIRRTSRDSSSNDVPSEGEFASAFEIQPAANAITSSENSPVTKEEEKTEKVIPEPEALIKALQDLENAATADAEIRKKIASLPPSVSDINGLNKLKDVADGRNLEAKVDEAMEILQSYNKRLSEEMEARKAVARLLHDYISHQKDLLSEAEETLEEYRSKYSNIQKVSHELKDHIQNLPDISKLPNLGGGLAPLPSAGDLFT